MSYIHEFFLRFLVFELLSILYFTVVNSELRLRHSVALQDMRLTLTCSDQRFNPKTRGIQGRAAPLQFFFQCPQGKNIKSNIFKKLRIIQKKIFMQIMSIRSIPILSANLAAFQEKCELFFVTGHKLATFFSYHQL